MCSIVSTSGFSSGCCRRSTTCTRNHHMFMPMHMHHLHRAAHRRAVVIRTDQRQYVSRLASRQQPHQRHICHGQLHRCVAKHVGEERCRRPMVQSHAQLAHQRIFCTGFTNRSCQRKRQTVTEPGQQRIIPHNHILHPSSKVSGQSDQASYACNVVELRAGGASNIRRHRAAHGFLAQVEERCHVQIEVLHLVTCKHTHISIWCACMTDDMPAGTAAFVTRSTCTSSISGGMSNSRLAADT